MGGRPGWRSAKWDMTACSWEFLANLSPWRTRRKEERRVGRRLPHRHINPGAGWQTPGAVPNPAPRPLCRSCPTADSVKSCPPPTPSGWWRHHHVSPVIRQMSLHQFMPVEANSGTVGLTICLSSRQLLLFVFAPQHVLGLWKQSGWEERHGDKSQPWFIPSTPI